MSLNEWKIEYCRSHTLAFKKEFLEDFVYEEHRSVSKEVSMGDGLDNLFSPDRQLCS